MVVYNKIGVTYNSTRKADSKILDKILQLTETSINKILLDVGAGTGNYANELIKYNSKVIALEPSEKMIEQGKKENNVIWMQGVAEKIDLTDKSVDIVICILSTHHFTDLNKSINEIMRVLKSSGVLVIYTYIPYETEKFWLEDYFPKVFEIDRKKFADKKQWIKILEENCGKEIQIEKFELAKDNVDNFLAANWAKPQNYLREDIIKGISTFALLEKEQIESGQLKLRNDIENGSWEEKYGKITENDFYDVGYRFIKVKKI